MADILSAFARHLADRRSARTVTTYVRVADAFSTFSGLADYSARMPWRAEVEGFLGATPARRRTTIVSVRRSVPRARRTLPDDLRRVATRSWPRCARSRRSDGAISGGPTDGIPFAREPVRDPPVLAASEVRRRLFEAGARIDDTRRRALVLAAIALLSQAALRLHELVALDVQQVDVVSATLLEVHGKGGTVHDLPLNPPTVALARGWLAERARLVSVEEPALFISARRTRLSMRSVQHMVAALGASAGIAKRISPHVLRHSAATLALTMGTDISTVGELLRHSDLN